MPSQRTLLALAAAAALMTAAVLLVQAHGRAEATSRPAAAPVVAPGAAGRTAALTGGGAGDGPATRSPAGTADQAGVLAGADAAASQLLQAAGTVDRFCKLVTRDRRRAAASLLATARVWPLRELRTVSRLRLRAARLYAAPDARTLVLRARVHLHGEPGCRLRDGRHTLFFTLGRVGTITGGWLISAVSARP